MKKRYLFVMFLAIIANQASAQFKSDTVSVVFKTAQHSLSKSHVIDLDGRVIAQEVLDYINPDDLQSFKIGKDSTSNHVYVKLKKGLNYNFLSMQEISNKYIKKPLQNPLFFVDGTLVTNADFLLAEHNIRNISVSASEVLPYQSGQKFDVIKILTKSPAQYFVRGN